MIVRGLSRLMSPQVVPGVAALLFLVLAIAPEAKWRLRDPGAALSGVPDVQNMTELALYGAIATWVGWHLIRGYLADRYRVRTLGPAVLLLVLATTVVVASGLTALSVRSMSRAVQYAIMTGMVVLIWWEAYQDDAFFLDFWPRVRRGFVGFAVVATVLTALIPTFDGFVDDFGVARYGWLRIHPIVTAGMIGLTLIMLAGAVLGLQDRWLRRRIFGLAAGTTALVLVILLLLTKSRGATSATLGAVIVLLLLSRNARYRRVALLGLVAVAGAALAYFSAESGSQQFQGFVNRGQTTEQVLSLSQRTDLIDIGMVYFREQPIFGHGYMIPGALLRTHFFWAGHAHNVALEIAMGMGVIGILAFLGVVLASIRGLWFTGRSALGRYLGVAAEGAAILLFLLLQGVISDGFGGPVGFEVAGLGIVVLIADLGWKWRRVGIPRLDSEGMVQPRPGGGLEWRRSPIRRSPMK